MLVFPISNFEVKDLQSEAHEQTANKACLLSQSFSHGAILVIVQTPLPWAEQIPGETVLGFCIYQNILSVF